MLKCPNCGNAEGIEESWWFDHQKHKEVRDFKCLKCGYKWKPGWMRRL